MMPDKVLDWAEAIREAAEGICPWCHVRSESVNSFGYAESSCGMSWHVEGGERGGILNYLQLERTA